MAMAMEMGEKVSVEAMVASLFREDDDDDEEVRELQAEIERLAAKAQHYSSQGPSLISSRLQTYLHHTRPDLSLDDRVDDDDDHDDGGREEDDPRDDDAIAQAKLLKAQIAALKKDIPALLQRMKGCLEACEKKQKVCEERKPPLPGFLQDVHKVWESFSPYRGIRMA